MRRFMKKLRHIEPEPFRLLKFQGQKGQGGQTSFLATSLVAVLVEQHRGQHSWSGQQSLPAAAG
jgi:hypothetical protein